MLYVAIAIALVKLAGTTTSDASHTPAPNSTQLVVIVGDPLGMTLSGAAVTLSSSAMPSVQTTISSNRDGAATFAALDRATYGITVTLASYQTSTRTITSGPGSNDTVQVRLRPLVLAGVDPCMARVCAATGGSAVHPRPVSSDDSTAITRAFVTYLQRNPPAGDLASYRSHLHFLPSTDPWAQRTADAYRATLPDSVTTASDSVAYYALYIHIDSLQASDRAAVVYVSWGKCLIGRLNEAMNFWDHGTVYGVVRDSTGWTGVSGRTVRYGDGHCRPYVRK